MKSSFTFFLGLAVLAALCLAQNANAAPVGSLSCTTTNGDLAFNVSYFTVGITVPPPSSGGVGAGKPTFQPLEVHAALATFETLLTSTSSGTHFDNCTLTTTLSDGATGKFVFKTVEIKSLTAVAERTGSNETPARYTDIEFDYLQIEVSTSGGTDDGGTTPTTSTNKITVVGGGGGAN